MPSAPLDVVRFGDDFELDRRAYQLRCGGRAAKLERIPMELLLLLIERRGELVTRKEIIDRIWGENVFLDTDNSINAAIRKIRQVLKEDPENPRFIETVTGKGYRFAARVEETAPPEVHGPAPGPSASSGAFATGAAQGTSAERSSGRKYGRARVYGAVVVALAVSAYFLLHRPPKLSEKDTVVLADFTNGTGDPVFDDTLRQGMSVQLQQSPFLSLLSEERLQKTLRLMGQAGDTRLTPEIAQEICARTASAAVLKGSIISLGKQYVLGLQAKDCRTGNLIAEEQGQAARKEDVLSALSQMVSRLRQRIGESLAALQQHDIPLAEATTSSLEALKAYSTAEKVRSSLGPKAAMVLYKQAIEIDPKFAMAYARLGHVYGEMGESDLAAASTGKAYELRDRVGGREKYFLALSYEFRVLGNLEKAQQTCELWAQNYPRDGTPRTFQTVIHQIMGRYEDSVEEANRSIELDPDFYIGYANLAAGYLSLNQLKQADETLQRASDRKLQFPDFQVMRYDIAFLRGDMPGMERVVSSSRTLSGTEDLISDNEAFALAYSGRVRQARKMSSRAVELAEQAEDRETAALFETGAALREAFAGNAQAAKARAAAALALTTNREVEFGVAFALALSGDSARAQALGNDLGKRFGEDTSVRFEYLPALRGMLSVMRGEPVKAVELVDVASPYELGTPRSAIHGYFGALYPVYVRGLADLAAHKGPEAVREFQKILEHRGVVVSDPIGALSRLQLGRAYALSGDTSKAEAAYQDFLALWKDADSDVPILRQAKIEYAKLR